MSGEFSRHIIRLRGGFAKCEPESTGKIAPPFDFFHQGKVGIADEFLTDRRIRGAGEQC